MSEAAVAIQSLDETEEFLSQIDVFSGLPRVHLRRIVEIGKETSFKKGETIFEEGEESGAFFLILEGKVRISRLVPGMGEEALAVLKETNYFGEMSLVDKAPRSASAIAHESCRLFGIAQQDFLDVLFVDRNLAYEILWNFVRTMAKRLRDTNDKFTFLATTNKF